MKNYTKVNVGLEARAELHEQLNLSGAEISLNNLPAGTSVPFIHSHKQNEEIYGILSGKGKAEIDGEIVQLSQGDWFMVLPNAKRRIFAAEDTGISYICIQVKEGSLEQYTIADAVLHEA